MTLLNNKDLSKEFIKFETNYSFYSEIQSQAMDSYFKGPIWELKKSIGSLSLLTSVVRKRDYNKINNNNDSYFKLINTPLAIATFENQWDINGNSNNALKQIESISKKIIQILTELKK